jgi:phosphoribosylaminoimidazole-succinocarboxamide synthase
VKPISHGKVRDIYEGPAGCLVMVASDRISAFDVVMEEAIPDKGKVLTGLTLFWLSKVDSLCPTHLVTADPNRYDDGTIDDLGGRSMLVRAADMIPVECVARGYLFGSVVNEYEETGMVGGVRLPAGLRVADRLPEPIFSPAIKATSGHDENITFDQAVALHGGDLMDQLRELTLMVYERGAAIAEERGIILADTKFEFGIVDGEVTLCDEVLTPDSSRYWASETYKPGTSPPSLDKQPLRDYLATTSWDRTPPPPRLPAKVVDDIRRRYADCYQRVTEESFEAYVERMS